MVGRRCYVLLRRRYDVPIRRRRDAPLRRPGDVPSRRRWLFHLRRTCDVAGTYRETSLRRRHDVLMPGGKSADLQLQNMQALLPKSFAVIVNMTDDLYKNRTVNDEKVISQTIKDSIRKCADAAVF